MLGATDRHFRQLARFLSQKALLYTELVHAQALVRGTYALTLPAQAQGAPVALQLAGGETQDLAQAAAIATPYGFSEINLNIGCPSSKGVAGQFGLCLMEDPPLVARCFRACRQATNLPVTIKCRLGSNPAYPWEKLLNFVELLAQEGCQTFIVHARKADLKRYDTHQNRSLVPLDYPAVYRLKELYPQLEWVINGNITNNEEAAAHLRYVDGVMLGRSLYHNLFLLEEVDRLFFALPTPKRTREEYLKERALPYIEREIAQGAPLSHFVRHLLGLYQYQRQATFWRRYLSQNAYKPGATLEVVYKALEEMASRS